MHILAYGGQAKILRPVPICTSQSPSSIFADLCIELWGSQFLAFQTGHTSSSACAVIGCTLVLKPHFKKLGCTDHWEGAILRITKHGKMGRPVNRRLRNPFAAFQRCVRVRS